MNKLIVSLLTISLLAVAFSQIFTAGMVEAQEARLGSVSASSYFGGAAIDTNGMLWKWGGLSDKSSPHVVAGITNAAKITGGMFSTFVLKDDGIVWMLDFIPRAGVPGAYDNLDYPLKLDDLVDVVDLSCVNTECLALKADGTVWRLTDDLKWTSLNLDHVKQISLADDHWVLVRTDGTVRTSGISNIYGGYRDQATDGCLTVDQLQNIKMVAAGSEFSMALSNDGTVWTWGRNNQGQLGDGQTVDTEPYRSNPKQVPGLHNITYITASSWSAYALRDDGTVWAWGENRDYGTLGDGTFESKNRPVRVGDLSGIVQISATRNYALALDESGNMWGWGRDDYGQLGDGGSLGYSQYPVRINLNGDVTGASVRPAVTTDNQSSTSTSHSEACIRYLAVSGDGTIYAFYPHKLEAYAQNGALKWSLPVSDRWMYGDEYKVVTGMDSSGYSTQLEAPMPIFDTSDGYLYLYTLSGLSDDDLITVDRWESTDPTKERIERVEKVLIAVTPDGQVAWTYRVTDSIGVEDKASIKAIGDRIYFFHCYNETVIDTSGKVLYTISNIADPAAIGDNGTVYTLAAKKLDCSVFYEPSTGTCADYRVPGDVLEAYAYNGSLLWRKSLGQDSKRWYVSPDARRQSGSLPLYCNGGIYVPSGNGLTALDSKGNILWANTFPVAGTKLLSLMPADADGNLYFLVSGPEGSGSARLLIIAPDGSQKLVTEESFSHAQAGFNGILYEVIPVEVSDSGNSGLGTVRIRAFDVKSATYLWDYTLPVNQTHTVLVTSTNAQMFFHDTMAFHPVTQGSGYVWANIIPSGDLVYVDFRAASYGNPIEIDQTNVTYTSAIYAINNSSGIVMEQPLDSYTQAVAANNSTIYYATQDGKLSIAVIVAGAAAGLVILGSAVLLGKFFLLGAIARARNRIDNNENRDMVLRFVVDNPGTTLSEISRYAGLNMGTIRYHMLILELNHKVRVFKEGKFIRYFPNSNLYSPDEQLIIALLRRDPVKGILQALAHSASQTNSDISRRVGLSESSVNETLKILCDKGVARKEKTPDGRILYTMRPEMAEVLNNVELRLPVFITKTVPVCGFSQP